MGPVWFVAVGNSSQLHKLLCPVSSSWKPWVRFSFPAGFQSLAPCGEGTATLQCSAQLCSRERAWSGLSGEVLVRFELFLLQLC